jgi:lysyl-tRNA synthetase class 2
MLDALRGERIRKLRHVQALGFDAYPATVKRTAPLSTIVANFSSWSRAGKKIYAAARIKSMRDQGGIVFLTLADESGEIQAVLQKINLKDFDIWKETLDVGDFVEVSGKLFKTKRGEKSIEARTLRLLVKALRPIPSEFYGLHDTETRLRKRYLDLLTHPELRDLFRKKNVFWKTIREFLTGEGFLEVETPVLEATPGGADAEPFITHHNALDTDFYLRISLEISLKKLLVGGFERVFEIGRIFRNEGIDAEHLQDYTQVEFYWAYADYEDLMKLVERMYKQIVKAVNGSMLSSFRGKKINWGRKWPKIDYYEIFEEKTGIGLRSATRDQLFKKAVELDLYPQRGLGRGRLIDLIYKKTVRPELIQPAFLVNPPIDIEPLAKRLAEDPSRVARFQVVACASELGKGFSEANDPLDERERFIEQMRLREKGDKEAQRLDEDFLEALEYGMPPAAGFGLSERFFSVLVNKPMRETIFFPPMRARLARLARRESKRASLRRPTHAA